jgi:hypothetical protein
VPDASRRPMCPPRSSRSPSWTRGARSNDNKPATKPGREALGRSRGGLTSKIHLAADARCRPISRITSAGHRHDSVAFEPVIGGIRIYRRGRGRPRTRPDRVWVTRPTPAVRSAPTCGDAGSGPTSPNQPTRRTVGYAEAAKAGGHRR